MFLERKIDEDLIEVLDIGQLLNPCLTQFLGRSHCGEEIQDPQMYPKNEMVFTSGEKLPKCWSEPDYRLKSA